MSWLKKFWYLLVPVAVLIFMGIRIGRNFLSSSLKPLKKRVTTEAVVAGSEEVLSVGKNASQNTSMTYDYKRMVLLIEQTQELKRVFNEHFTGFASKRYKPINIKQAKTLLSDLYREKNRLQHFVWALKVKYHGHIPEKRRQTMLYYQKVIDTCIGDVEIILRRV